LRLHLTNLTNEDEMSNHGFMKKRGRTPIRARIEHGTASADRRPRGCAKAPAIRPDGESQFDNMRRNA
jgi:hypothetical protein